MKQYHVTDIFKTRWDQLTITEMEKIITLSGGILQHAPDTRAYGLHVIEILKTLRTNKRVVSKINEEQAVDIFNDITFFKRKVDGSFLEPWLFFPIKNINVKGELFPAPSFVDIPMVYHTFDQLIYADHNYTSFVVMMHEINQEGTTPERENKLNDAINGMIAALYSDPKTFSIDTLAQRAARLNKLSLSQRMLIVHTFANVRLFIMSRYPHLFPKQEEDATVDPLATPPPPQLTGPMWLNLRYDLAETEVFKGLEVARKANMYEALQYLDMKIKQSKNNKPNS